MFTMKLTTITLTTLLPLLAFSTPTPEDLNAPLYDPTPANTIEKRAVTGTVDADALKYRRCPRTSCDAVGQYPRGTRITINCYTDKDTTVVEGYKYVKSVGNLGLDGRG